MHGASEFAYDCGKTTSSMRSGSTPNPLDNGADYHGRKILGWNCP